MNNGLSYYDVLNVTPKATDDEVKAAYRLLAKKHHPDFNPQNRRMAELKLKALNEAYAELKTREKRIAYNRSMRIKAQNDNGPRLSFFSALGGLFWPSSKNSAGA